jgi:hypothetical protein
VIFGKSQCSANSVENVCCKKMSFWSEVEFVAETGYQFHAIKPLNRAKIIVIRKGRNGK